MIQFMTVLKAYTDSSVELSVTEQVLWFRLFLINNKAGWAEWFGATNRRLLLETGIKSEKTLIAARNALKQKGFIDFVAGKKGQPTKYTVMVTVKNTVNGTNTVTSTVNPTVKTTVNPTVKTTDIKDYRQETRDYSSKPDLLTFEKPGLSPAEEQVKSAFENTFHPLTKLEDLDMLKAYVGGYGAKSVIRAINAASKSKSNSSDRVRLSPRYLLPILQREDEEQSAPTAETVVKNPDMSWIPKYTTPEEDKAMANELRAKLKAMRGY
jgi:hypothetical protein